MNESNALLAQQFRQNDPSAFAKLVGRHHSLVFNVCLRILGHRQDAEDATQETFSRVARYLHRWDSKRPFEPWLVAIAGNRSRTLLAKRRGTRQMPLLVEPLTDEHGARQAADGLREELYRALDQIAEGPRQAFTLFHERAMSYAEIAEQLQCPIGTAKTWVHRARCGVLEQLREREVVAGKSAPSADPVRTRAGGV